MQEVQEREWGGGISKAIPTSSIGPQSIALLGLTGHNHLPVFPPFGGVPTSLALYE